MNKRKKRRLIAYCLRTIVVIIVSVCLVLMICGCLYIHEHLHPVKVEAFEDHVSGHSKVALAEVLEKAKYTVMLDPGHGGKDQGTCQQETLEKDINLTVSLLLKEELEKRDIAVIMTRETDDFLKLSERTDLANDMQTDLFISIHCNYCKETKSVSGLECYSYTEQSSGKKYADRIINYLEQNSAIETRGTRYEDFYVLRNTEAPAVLIELGYLSNGAECRNLGDKDYQKQLSEKLADAIADSLEK